MTWEHFLCSLTLQMPVVCIPKAPISVKGQSKAPWLYRITLSLDLECYRQKSCLFLLQKMAKIHFLRLSMIVFPEHPSMLVIQ